MSSSSTMSSSRAPSNTGVATCQPSARAARPKWTSSTWPMFMRLGTPSGLSTISSGVPSARKGISSSGKMRLTTPLLPWRPAILSPTEILRFWAMYTRTIWFTPGESSSRFSRVNSFTSTTMPNSPCGTRSEVSRTSRTLSPKMARSRRSSAVSSVSPLGVTLPTRISFARTSAPMRMMPRSSKSRRASSPTPEISRVISSGPSLVSRASDSYSSMWIEV